MASKAEQIMQAIVTLLTVPPMSSVPSADVHRDVTVAIDSAVSAAIAVEEGDEPEPSLFTIGVADRVLDVRLTALAKGHAASSLADAPMVEAHNRLMANLTLGGLADDIEEGPSSRERAQREKPVAAITKTYRVRYRTGARSVES
ncbi:MAG: hypothetical protein H6R10_704 [Rhodocyclaceae bacterium]|nr:hypothetical protein [Rhodocyclaceae bacterium]